MKTELLIGCGNSRVKNMHMTGDKKTWDNLTTLDFSPKAEPHVLHDLEVLPYPFGDNTFDEIHAYEVLEHIADQGDWKSFFAQFGELHRILKPAGFLLASVPRWDSIWAWGDPSHRRVISTASLTFLAQEAYVRDAGSARTDFRETWKRDFPMVWSETKGDQFYFILQARKNAVLGYGDNNMEQGESL